MCKYYRDDFKTISIVLLSFFLTIVMLSVGKMVYKESLRQRMIDAARLSYRIKDGAPNLIILDGISGYVSDTNIYLKYFCDGSISIKGNNTSEDSKWKIISSLKLEPGKYTLTGLHGLAENSIQLQLTMIDQQGNKSYCCQFDNDETFEINKQIECQLYIRVFPYTAADTVARPALYRDDNE